MEITNETKKVLEAELTADEKAEEIIFTRYRDSDVVGREMCTDFLESNDTIIVDNNRYVFRLEKNNDEEGILGMSYGYFLLSTFLDRYNVGTKIDENEENMLNEYEGIDGKKIIGSLITLKDYVKENGYDVSPFLTADENKKLFGKKDSFIESLTWSMSCFLYARRIIAEKKLIDFSQNEEMKNVMNKTMSEITELIAECLGILVDNVIVEGENRKNCLGYQGKNVRYIGWGPVTGCEETSLYFTHSVCETFGDIEDTMTGNDALGIKRNEEFIAEVNKAYQEKYCKGLVTEEWKKDIVATFQEVCGEVGKNVFLKYKDKIGKKFFYADGSEIGSVEQIGYSIQSPVLLNQLYVVLSAVYVNYHKVLEEQSNKDEFNDFCAMIKNAVDMVYETYIDLRNKGKANIVNREYATFYEKHPRREIGEALRNVKINVAILETLIIKAKAMIVTYVSKYPEKELGEMLKILNTTRLNEHSWLWSESGYDLQHTERSVSAIREFYDYYEKYQKKAAEVNEDYEELNKQYNDKKKEYEKQKEAYIEKIREYDKLEKEFEEEKEKLNSAIEQLKVENTRLIESEKPVENAVRLVIKETLRDALAEELVNVFKSISKSNESIDAGNQLEEKYKNVKEELINMLISSTIPYTFNGKADLDAKWDGENEAIKKVMKADMDNFISKWINQVTMINRPNGEYKGQVLSELVKKQG